MGHAWYVQRCPQDTSHTCNVTSDPFPQDRDDLDWCGPDPGPRANETRRSLDDEIPRPRSAESSELQQRDAAAAAASLGRRWLQPEQIGEEYAPCRSCPTATTNSTCRTRKRYEFNDTVVSQCLTDEFITFPNGSFQINYWLVCLLLLA